MNFQSYMDLPDFSCLQTAPVVIPWGLAKLKKTSTSCFQRSGQFLVHKNHGTLQVLFTALYIKKLKWYSLKIELKVISNSRTILTPITTMCPSPQAFHTYRSQFLKLTYTSENKHMHKDQLYAFSRYSTLHKFCITIHIKWL